MQDLTPIPNQQLQNSSSGEFQKQTKIQLLRLAHSERKISECTQEQVKSALKYVFVLLGLSEKDIPDDYEKTVILNFIFTHYGLRYSCSDIRNAFEMGIAGAYQVEKELYNKRFSALYLSKWMEAYNQYKVSMFQRFPYHQPQLPKKTERDPKELEESIYKVIEKFIMEHQKIPPIYDLVSCYNVLVRRGEIQPTPELDEQKKQTALSKHSIEMGRVFLSIEPNESRRRKEEFQKPENLEIEVKRQYLLDYWAKRLIVAQ